jgi:hypothetical protein
VARLPAAGRLPDIGQINRAVGIDAVVRHNTWSRLSSEVGSLTDIGASLHDVRFTPECVAKLFRALARGTIF